MLDFKWTGIFLIYLLCVLRLLLTCPLPVHPGVGHFKTFSCMARTKQEWEEKKSDNNIHQLKIHILKIWTFLLQTRILNSVTFWPQKKRRSKGPTTQRGWCLQHVQVYPYIAVVWLPTCTSLSSWTSKEQRQKLVRLLHHEALCPLVHTPLTQLTRKKHVHFLCPLVWIVFTKSELYVCVKQNMSLYVCSHDFSTALPFRVHSASKKMIVQSTGLTCQGPNWDYR